MPQLDVSMVQSGHIHYGLSPKRFKASFVIYFIAYHGYYVYVYLDPRSNIPFYIGKGKNGRALDHLSEHGESDKHKTIAEIKNAGLEPSIEILIHDLKDEKTAFAIETAIIDLIGLDNLTNKVRGSNSSDFGRMTVQQLVGHYSAKPIEIEHKVILIRINQTFRHNMSSLELYEATRGTWDLGDRKKHADYAIPVFNGVTKEIYKIKSWDQGGTTQYSTRNLKPDDRVEFTGCVDDTDLREFYINRDVRKYFKRGNPRSCVYVNF